MTLGTRVHIGRMSDERLRAKRYEEVAVKNNEFRRVLHTAKHCQLVVMALGPKEEIGAEVHELDSSFAWSRGRARRFSTAFGRRFKQASLYSCRPGPSTTSSIPELIP